MKKKRLDKYRVELQREGSMHVPGLIFADEAMLKSMEGDRSPEQVANVATLPGIVGHSMAMPDIHWGYGFPIGGVAAFSQKGGVVSPGGVGYDINCGVRLLRTDLTGEEIAAKGPALVKQLFRDVPSGIGSSRKDLKFDEKELKKILREGAGYLKRLGMAEDDDLDHIESRGCITPNDPNLLSKRALARGRDQLGTLGSGNHFLEVGFVSEVFDDNAASALGLRQGFATVLIHTGSRGLGYQTCDDFLLTMQRAAVKYNIPLVDRQLCCAPLDSEEGQEYLLAMACAANFAFANRQAISHFARESFEQIFKKSYAQLGLSLVYDIAHNIAKMEQHEVDGRQQTLCVHRKGATRAFPPGHAELPEDYRQLGQPVIIPGDMGTCSYVLLGTEKAMDETFGSTCHGAGRRLSRKAAMKAARGRSIHRELEEKGILVQAKGHRTLAEEMPEAYKDVNHVVDVVDGYGISQKVVKLEPLLVVKG